MSDRSASLLPRLRQPEYTGANRCLPCTVVNVAMALVGSLLLYVLASVEVAALGLVVALLAIYFRGYLVPGTPTLTKRYFPDRVLAAFEKEPPGTDDAAERSWDTVEKIERERQAGIEPEPFLREIGAVEECERDAAGGDEVDGDSAGVDDDSSDDANGDGDGVESTASEDDAPEARAEDGPALCLTDEFAAALDDALERADDAPDDPAAIARLFDADPEDVSEEGMTFPRFKVGARIRKWPSDAALRLDVAADAAVAEWTDRWRDVPVRDRHATRHLLRSFQDTCPDCGGDLENQGRTVESCCRTGEVVSVECEDCGARVLESAP